MITPKPFSRSARETNRSSSEDRDGTLMSIVDFGGIKKDVCLQYIPDAEVGQYVVVHVGFALQRLDE